MTGSLPVKRRRKRRFAGGIADALTASLFARPSSCPRTGAPSLMAWLACALDDEGAGGRVIETAGQDFLVFGGIVPAPERRLVGEFDDDDAFGLRPAFDQFG